MDSLFHNPGGYPMLSLLAFHLPSLRPETWQLIQQIHPTMIVTGPVALQWTAADFPFLRCLPGKHQWLALFVLPPLSMPWLTMLQIP